MSCSKCIAIIPLLVAGWLSGCATPTSSGYRYNEVVIVNRTRAPVTDVTVAATGSGRLFGCANIAPRGICSNQFPSRSYRGEPIEVTWSFAGGARRNEIIDVQIPANANVQGPMRGVLVIDSRGGIQAYLQPVAPGPHR